MKHSNKNTIPQIYPFEYVHSPRQIYFAKLRDHAIPFFINKIKLPPSTVFLLLLFSYLMYMYDVHAKTVPTNLDTFVKIGKKHHYHPRLSAKRCFSARERRLSLESKCLIGILFHFLLKASINLIFVKYKLINK